MSNYRLKETMFQSFLIFISVFLGIIAGNWNEERKEELKTKEYLKKLQTEIESNKKLLTKAEIYHKQMQLFLDSLYNKDPGDSFLSSRSAKYNGFYVYKDWNGIGTAFMQKSIYQAGISSNLISNIPIDLLTSISSHYELQNTYRSQADLILNEMMGFNDDTKIHEIISVLNLLAYETQRIEKKLSESCDKTIMSIKNN